MSLTKQQHEGFAKFFEKPTRKTLRDLIRGNTGETDYLDFKKEWPAFPKLAKHILALSNSGGGALIIGVLQNDKGVNESCGLPKITDKEKINKGLKNILPDSVSYDVLDFSYTESEYPKIKGKNFQVLLVEYEPKFMPYLAKKAGAEIKDNTVYVRRGTSSDEATHEELQKIINSRIETGYSSKHYLELEDHLDQLKTLYNNIKSNNRIGSAFARAIAMLDGDPEKGYREFVNELILKKKSKIEEELGLGLK